MNQVPEMLVNYEAYLDGDRIIGTVDLALPNIQSMTQTVQGAGIAGSADVPVLGHTQDMTSTVNFRTAHVAVRELLPQKYHHIEYWGAIQNLDTGTGELTVKQHKIIMKMMPKGDNLGNFNPGELQGRSIEFNVSYLKEMVDNQLIREIDKFNYKYDVGGQDLLGQVRTAVGL
jgi:P2 family phage contractile tail tube protein